MSTDHKNTWLPFYMGDFLASTASLSHEEKFAYLLLIWEYWRNGAPLKNDKKMLKNIAKISLKKLNNILPFFVLQNGNLYHHRIEKELSKSRAHQEKNIKKTEAARAAKAAKSKSVTESVDRPVTTHTTTTTNTLLSESITHTHDFENLEFKEEFAAIAAAEGLSGDPGGKCWRKFKVHFSGNPPQDPLRAWKKWAMNERKPPTNGHRGDLPKTAANPLTIQEEAILRLGSIHWKRKQRGEFISQADSKFIADYEAQKGAVWWVNLQQWRESEEKPPD